MNEPSRKVLLIGWDAADWKLITPLLEAGHLPCLGRLIERPRSEDRIRVSPDPPRRP